MDAVFLGNGWPDFVRILAERAPLEVRVRRWDRATPLHEAIRDADVLLPSNQPLDRAALEAATRLKLVQQPAAGYDKIDLAAARARGVPVCNAPGASLQAVAETAIFLMMALARRLPAAQQALREGRVGEPVGIELGGRTLGIVGHGKIGRRVGELAAAMGMEVHGTSSRSSRDDLHAMLARSDFVSVHCLLDGKTRGLLDAEAFRRMKPGAYLVNCARGAVVDRGALERALDDGTLAGVGLDVFWQEPWDPNDPLFARPNVVALPHIAGSTEETFGAIADICLANIRRVMSGEPPLHRVD